MVCLIRGLLMNKSFEEKVGYFTDLVFKNIQSAKNRKNKRKEVFANLKVLSKGNRIIVFNKKQHSLYVLYKKEIEEYDFEQYLTKYLALYYIDRLTLYLNKKVSFEEFAEIKKEAPQVVKDILKQKNNISEQLILLRRNRDIAEVQEYIDEVYDYKYSSDYTKYLIDRYYYDIKGLVRPEKNSIERMFKLLLS